MWAKCGLNLYLCSMATIKFLIQSNNNPSGIYVRLKEGRAIDIKARTKYLVNPEEWSTSKGQPKYLKDDYYKQLNEDLKSLSDQLLKHYNQCVKHEKIDIEWLKNFINPKQKEDDITSKLVEYIDYYTLHKKNVIGSSTYKRNQVYKKLIERFEKESNVKFFIKDVNANFKLKFETYCEQQGYAHNTIARTVKFIKTICRHARGNSIETSFQLDSISVRLSKVDKIYLTSDELDKIEKKQFDLEHLDNARDWLLISCDTGQRVSDFIRFTNEQIRYEAGVPLIEFTQVKTGKIMAIPLSKRVRSILDKRQGKFPRRISDQRYNEYIKEVCKLAKLTQMVHGSKIDTDTIRKVSGVFPKYELVTSHIGRRSFSTNNYGRIPTSLLINVTGHSTESMFLEYIGKSNTEKAIQLAEYF
jgi:integrase